MRLLNLFLSVFVFSKGVFSANILGVFPLEWGSHYILGTKLLKGLAEAGHNITMISPRKFKNPPKNGGWTDVVLDGFGEDFINMLGTIDFFDNSKLNVFEKISGFAKLLLYISNETLQHPNVKKFINSGATFNAVIVDQLMNDCHHGFAYHYQCPLILLSSIGPNPMINPKVGNPSTLSTIPSLNKHVDESSEISFMERLQNLFIAMITHLVTEFYIFPQHDKFLHDAFPDAPDIQDLYYNASLILLNSHSSLVKAVPMVPNMVEIGGYHIDPPQKLPEDLQNFLDSAKDGVIYFSMGSSIKSKDMHEKKKNVLVNVFRKLKQKVLWKFEEDLRGRPKNVLIKNWMPQQDILAHPNIKLFITHGGLLSATETIYHGVPVLVIPVFGDQEMNANTAVQTGIGLKISYNDENFNEETLDNLIQELLNNPKYRENTQSRSKIFHDRPMKPMESAVFWTEYVIRHKGAPHLRVAGVGMSWYKYYMVDVFVVLFISIALVILGLRYFYKKLLGVCFSKTTKHSKRKTD